MNQQQQKKNLFTRNRSATNSSSSNNNYSPFAIPISTTTTTTNHQALLEQQQTPTTTTTTTTTTSHQTRSSSIKLINHSEQQQQPTTTTTTKPPQPQTNSASSTARKDTTTPKSNHLQKLTNHSIPKLKRASSKVFNQFPHPFTSSSSTTPTEHPSLLRSNHNSQDSLIETIQATPSTLTNEPNNNNNNNNTKDNLSDYDPITPADIRSFEDDGQEGSLQDALDIGDPNSLTDTIVTLTTSEEPNRASLLSSSNPHHHHHHHHQQQQHHPQQQQHQHQQHQQHQHQQHQHQHQHQHHHHHHHHHPNNQTHHQPSPPSSQELKPGKQHGAFPYPSTPPPKPQPNSPSKQPSLLVRQLTKTSKMLNHQQNQTTNNINNQQASSSSSSSSSSDQFLSPPNHTLETLRRPLPQPSRDSALSIVATGPAALPSRLSGWFQHAFSSSSSHLPLLNPTAALTSPRSPDKLKPNHHQNQQPHKPAHLKGHSTPPDDHQLHRPTPVDPRRSPNSTAHLAPSNIRGLGNFFDKAVNYMFDTDAHSYDSRLTAELWIIGGQQFSGVWKWEEVQHDEGTYEDLGMNLGNPGTGSGSDASHHPPLSHKKRTGLRRVTVGKTKAIFKHHSNSSSLSHHSPTHSVRKSLELSISARKNNPNTPLSPSSTPSPEPSLAINPPHNRIDDPTLLSPLITHSYPPVFYHAFASIIGLTYRTDFPPIPCTNDRSKSSAIGAAGARVGGMLASLSLSIGRTGKKPRSGQGGSRSPSPHRQLGDRVYEDDRTPDSAPPKGLNSDVGWGCMLRTGQSMLANALLVTHLGRDWRRPITSITSPSSSVPVDPLYARLLSWFIDSSSPLAPFSVHHFTSKGKELGKEVGEWFGPSTAAGAIKALTNQFLPAGLGVATDVDGTVYRSDVFNASSFTNSVAGTGERPSSSSKTSWQRPVLVLINARLGLEGVNPVYYEAIKATFTFPQSVGIAGGRPSSSYYFCGHQGDSLFYIDPHHSRPAIPFEEPPQPLMLAAQRISLNPRTSYRKQDADWEQISSTDTDSVMSGSAGSDGFANRSRKQHQAKNSDKVSFQTGYSSSISINLRREQLDDFYAGAYPSSALQTFHPDKVRRMNLTALDPSMLLGFLVKDEADWEDLTARIRSFKPPLFHIAEVMPAWMRTNVDSTTSRTSADFRPSDDSDLGIDSWSEPEGEDWGTNSRAEDYSSSGQNSQSTGLDERDDGLTEGAPDDTESSTNVDSMSIDDEGWDNVESGSMKVNHRKNVIPLLQQPPGLGGLENPPNKVLRKLAEPEPSARESSRNAHISSHGRAQSVNVKQSFPQGNSTSRSVQHPYRHSTSLSEGDGGPAEVMNCLSRAVEPSVHQTKPMAAGVPPPSAFPTSQLTATAVSPTHSNRDEPRARNISAATVRARHSDEQLADSEETLNHRERRRLDSQGSLRALRA